jgi:hypothetical protein
MTYPVIPDVPSLSTSEVFAASSYPTGATALNATSGDNGAQINTATIAKATGKTTYISGFEVWATGATSAAKVDVTVSDGTWTLTYPLNVPATSTAIQLQPLTIRYNPPLQASATNTDITVTCPSLGTGNTNCCVNATGFRV